MELGRGLLIAFIYLILVLEFITGYTYTIHVKGLTSTQSKFTSEVHVSTYITKRFFLFVMNKLKN